MKKHLTLVVCSLVSILSWIALDGTSNLALAGRSIQGTDQAPRILYPKKTELDFEGLRIQGEVRNPGEFYYQRKGEQAMDSLIKRRPHFHREMLRDVVMSR
jgi:hypothetical protein